MYHKIPFVLAVVSLGLSSLYANPNDAQNVLANRLTRLVVQNRQSVDEGPYLAYQEKLSTITNPSYDTLRPLFVDLTVYNESFEKAQSQEERSQLANLLTQETWAGWNTYREIGMLEIFDLYFPQENKDKQIALLEYNIKSSLLSSEKRALIATFEHVEEETIAAVKDAYEQLVQDLQRAGSYNPKEIIERFLPLIEAYNQLEKERPGAPFFIKRAFFEQPFAAGWGRTTTVDELRYHIGMEVMGGGDYVCAYSPEELQQRYGVSAETASVFFQFVKEYNRNR